VLANLNDAGYAAGQGFFYKALDVFDQLIGIDFDALGFFLHSFYKKLMNTPVGFKGRYFELGRLIGQRVAAPHLEQVLRLFDI